MDLPLIAQELRRLENHSLADDLLSSTALEFIWTWSALILTGVSVAISATSIGILFSKLQLSRFRRQRTLIRLPSFYSSCDDDDDDASISSSDSEDDEEEESDEIEESDEEEEEESENFRGAKVNDMGNFSFSSFSLADLVGGMGVVKDWDGLGLRFDRNGGVVSFFDKSRGEIVRSFNGVADENTVVKLASPAEIVSVLYEAGDSVVRVWDARAGDEKPAVTALPLLRRRVTRVTGREGKVFVGDEGGQVAALDFRNLAQVEDGEGAGYWWRSAARCLRPLSPRLENA